MRTKVLDVHELWSGVESLGCVRDAIGYRMNDLTSTPFSNSLAVSVSLTLSTHADIFFQHKLDPEKQFQNFAYGIVGYPIFLTTSLLSEVSIVQVFP
jgi:hypothetical protein